MTNSFAAIGSGWWPVIIFLGVAFIFHIALRYTRYGKFTYAIDNPLAARVSGINVERHTVLVYMFAGLLSGLSGIVHTARAISGQAGVGVGFELDAIAAAVIGGTSLSGGVGRMTGTVIGAVILGILPPASPSSTSTRTTRKSSRAASLSRPWSPTSIASGGGSRCEPNGGILLRRAAGQRNGDRT